MPCTTVQPSEVSTKSDFCKLLPAKGFDVQDIGKPSEPGSAGLHIDCQVGRNSHKILSSKTFPVCKPSLRVKFRKVHAGRSIDAFTSSGMQNIQKVLPEYNLHPRKTDL